MTARRTLDTPTLDDLTPRQREVLNLVARGHTNGEIATRLGISLDGAKWHVSEIISRLAVSNREEAAALWKREHRIGSRLRRAFAALPFRPILAGGAAAAALGVGVIASVAVFDTPGDESPLSANPAVFASPSPDDDPRPSADPSPSPDVSPAPPATLTPGSTSATAVEGLFVTPQQPLDAEQRPLPEQPQSPFSPQDPGTVVLYDTLTGTEDIFGEGTWPVFTSNGEYLVWWREQNLYAAAVPDGEVIDLGPGYPVEQIGDDWIVAMEPDSGTKQRIQIPSGQREDFVPSPEADDFVRFRQGDLTLIAKYGTPHPMGAGLEKSRTPTTTSSSGSRRRDHRSGHRAGHWPYRSRRYREYLLDRCCDASGGLHHHCPPRVRQRNVGGKR